MIYNVSYSINGINKNIQFGTLEEAEEFIAANTILDGARIELQ